jgi:cyclophilin family peptidyl-prolyl cis-trans isomerase
VAAAARARGEKAAPRIRTKPVVEPRDWKGQTPVLVVKTSRGTFEVELLPSVAPLHVANVVGLAEKKFYDGLSWHRVVSSFVIQGGCPRGDGTGDPGYTIPDELSLEPYVRGTLGMPKTATKDTGGCQLFFTHGRTPHLEGRYTVFGLVKSGVEVIDAIEEGDAIESVTVKLIRKRRFS